MARYEIKGGNPLYGEVTISGAKNAAVAILPASILVEGKCRVENVPDISDVRILLDILRDMGAEVSQPETGVVEVPAGAAVPEAQAEEPEEAGVEAASSVSAFATLRLTTAQAGELLAEHTPVSDADGVLCYELSREDYDALLAALADNGVTPEPDEESAASDGAMADGFALVYVADEWPENAE